VIRVEEERSRDNRNHAVAIRSESRRSRRLRAVLAAGTDPNATDYDGRTGLHLAAAEAHLAAVRYLLVSGARPGAAVRWGGTPLTDAKRARHTAVAEFLAAQDPGGESASSVITDVSHLKVRKSNEEEKKSAV
jgi:glutaminase